MGQQCVDNNCTLGHPITESPSLNFHNGNCSRVSSKTINREASAFPPRNRPKRREDLPPTTLALWALAPLFEKRGGRFIIRRRWRRRRWKGYEKGARENTRRPLAWPHRARRFPQGTSHLPHRAAALVVEAAPRLGGTEWDYDLLGIRGWQRPYRRTSAGAGNTRVPRFFTSILVYLSLAFSVRVIGSSHSTHKPFTIFAR